MLTSYLVFGKPLSYWMIVVVSESLSEPGSSPNSILAKCPFGDCGTFQSPNISRGPKHHKHVLSYWKMHYSLKQCHTSCIQVKTYLQWNLSNWTPVYIEHLRALKNFSYPGTLPLKINGRLPGYIEHLSTLNIEHQICSRRPHLTCLLWTVCTDLKLFSENEDKWNT